MFRMSELLFFVGLFLFVVIALIAKDLIIYGW